ncbi:response regulator transcription factor [Thermomonas sp. HDW16]|uniref:response regulator transcription factor n=1 Tax=Thermomonas sp. HDW16 TaxID=2714945 RepID=UPI001408DC12|nr:response regulator transcription factor [Thermomonas sp. HDW16]QIL19333.1 response regulator transcription factor [Thermomonas sp. HDW16]
MQAGEIALTSVLVVEDDAAMQARSQRLLREVGGDDIRIDVAGDVATAREHAARGDYTLVLVDVQLPDGNGVDFIAWLREHAPQLPAVVLSSWAEEGTILSALRNGAIGYLLKNAEDIELAMHLRSLQRGGAPIDPVIARRILQLVPKAAPLLMSDAPRLSEREYEILGSVERGLSNREIAEATGLSRLTIETHTRNIYRKLAVRSRTEAVHAARERGLLQ